MTCPVSPFTSSLFSLIRHGNLKATGNRSHGRLLVLCPGFISMSAEVFKSSQTHKPNPQMNVCDHFPIVKLLYQQLIYKSDTYADICLDILQASWDSCPPVLLVDLSFKFRTLMDLHNGQTTLDLHGHENSSHAPVGVHSNAFFHWEIIVSWDQTFCKYLSVLMEFSPGEDSHA